MAKRFLDSILYVYTEEVNARRAQLKTAWFGSYSNYINYLIAQDHDDKESMKFSKEQAALKMTPTKKRTKKKAA